MAEEPKYFKTGLFVVVALLILIAAGIGFAAERYFHKSIRAESYFKESVHGLEVGAPVLFRGLEVGRVSAVTLTANEYETAKPLDERRTYVRVIFQVYTDVFPASGQKDTASLLKGWRERGMRVQKRLKGLTGTSYLEMTFMDETEQYPPVPFSWTPEYPYIPSAPGPVARIAASVQGLQEMATEVRELKLKRTVKRLDTLLAESTAAVEDARIEQLSKESLKLVKELRTTNGRLRKLVTDPELHQGIADGAAATQRLKKLVKTSAPEISKTASQLPEVTEELQTTLNMLAETLKKQRGRIDETVKNLEQASENLRTLSREAKNNPAGTFFGNPPPKVELEK